MEQFHRAVFPPSLRLCGRHLHAFTPWHQLLLGALGSPLIHAADDPDARVTPGDLLLALAICSTTWPKLPPLRPRLRDALWLRHLTRRPAAFRRAADHLGQWIDASQQGPLLWRRADRKGNPSDTPETLGLVYGLVSKAGLTESAAWNKPFGLAQFILAAVAELNGAEISFADPDALQGEPAPYQPTERDEIYTRALNDLGRPAADKFIAAWDRSQARGRGVGE